MSQLPFEVRDAALPQIATEDDRALRHSVNGHENSGARPAAFHSILFDGAAAGTRREPADAPPFFADLNLDQIVDAITAGRQEYAAFWPTSRRPNVSPWCRPTPSGSRPPWRPCSTAC